MPTEELIIRLIVSLAFFALVFFILLQYYEFSSKQRIEKRQDQKSSLIEWFWVVMIAVTFPPKTVPVESRVPAC